jgi:GT2 family glycosyltransferase
MKTAAVVVTMNRDEMLTDAIEALREEGVGRIIVVDNGGGCSLRNVEVVSPGENLGPAGGYALGIKIAQSADYVWLLNDDDKPLPGSRKKLIDEFADEHVGAVGSWVVHEDGTVRGRGSRWSGREEPVHREDPPTSYDADVTTFTGLMLRNSTIQKVGYPRSDFFMMFEEHEYCLRIRQAGLRIRIVSEPLVQTHAAGSSDGRSPIWRRYYMVRNQTRLALEQRSPRGIWWSVVRHGNWVLSPRVPYTRAVRFRVVLRAIRDARTNNMGRTVEPR